MRFWRKLLISVGLLKKREPLPKPIDSSDITLGLINIWQVLRKLWWEILVLESIPETVSNRTVGSSVLHMQDSKLYAAINAACTCSALFDWLFHSVRSDPALLKSARSVLPRASFKSARSLSNSLRRDHMDMQVCHQICLANKHYYLDWRAPDIKITIGQTVIHGTDDEVAISVLPIVTYGPTGSHTTEPAPKLLRRVADWWEETLTAIGLPDREQFFPELAINESQSNDSR